MAGSDCTTIAWEDLDEATLLACCRLWLRIWPKADEDPSARAARMRARQAAAGAAMAGHRVHVLSGPDGILALARSFRRVIRCDGRERPVLALASVCSDPDHRGAGHARQVVKEAFRRLDKHCPVAFFQTGVPGFYEKLGSRRIASTVVNRADGERAFWEPYAMIHPDHADWPYDMVDLCGSGW